MPHQRLLVGRVLTVAWKQPEHDDLAVIAAELRHEYARLGRPLLYLSVIGPSALPTGAVRDELVRFYGDVLGACDSMHVVIEGNEFQTSIKRSVIANVLLVLQGVRGRVFIENTLEHVVAASPPAVRAELAEATRVASGQALYEFARG